MILPNFSFLGFSEGEASLDYPGKAVVESAVMVLVCLDP
jgi:hypothetical protein